MSDVKLYLGDCLDVMREMEADSVDSIVTDPPYGLTFMGNDWDHGVPGVHFWEAALRVAKPGAHMLAFGGTRTHHRLMCAIEDAGWEIRDVVMWVYGSGFPKSHNLKDEWQGWGTALKPAWEPVIVARKPLIGTVAANVLEYGTGAMNIDECRVETEETGASREHGGKVYEGVAEGYQRPNKSSYTHKTDWYMRPAGRWPANLIHDGSGEVLALFPQTPAGNRPAVRNTSGVFTAHAQGETGNGMRMDSGSAARFFYCAKSSKHDRDEGLDGMPMSRRETRTESGAGAWEQKGPQPSRNPHPTVKPTDLMRYLCRLVTPPGGIVLDPFMGSGSTGKAAVLEGFGFIGIDLDAEYLEIARRRIEHAQMQPTLDELL